MKRENVKIESLVPLDYWRFYTRIVIDPVTQCWNWTGARLTFGYGCFTLRHKNLRASRFSYHIHKGEIKEGELIRHSCDNPPCCNPDHLYVGSIQDNNADRTKRGRHHQHISDDKVLKVFKDYSSGEFTQLEAKRIGKFKRKVEMVKIKPRRKAAK